MKWKRWHQKNAIICDGTAARSLYISTGPLGGGLLGVFPPYKKTGPSGPVSIYKVCGGADLEAMIVSQLIALFHIADNYRYQYNYVS